MAKLVGFCFAFAVVFGFFIIFASGIINYISHIIIGIKQKNHYWTNFDTLHAVMNIITYNERVRFSINDPTASLAYSFLILEEYVYKSTRVVRAALGERVVWADDYYLILYPLSWIRYNIWLTQLITDYKKELGL